MMSAPSGRSRGRSLWRVFAAPFWIALASTVGLISALVGDGLLDVTSWITLAIPVVASAWSVLRR